MLPQTGDYINGGKSIGNPKKSCPFAAKQRDEVVDNAVIAIQKELHHAANNHGGDKMRRVCNHLHGFFKAQVVQLVNGKCQDDRGGKSEQRQRGNAEGVDQDSLKVWIGNELLKIVQPNPRTPRDALSRAELAKSNLDAVHGHIVE